MYTTPQPFLQLTLPRAHKTLGRLKKMIWGIPQPLPVTFAGAHNLQIPVESARKRSFTPVELPFHWGRLMYQGWFHVDFPAAAPGKTRWLRWDDQGEGTLYLNGVPHYGFDVAHKEAPLPDDVSEGYVEGLCLQSAIWHHEAKGIDGKGSCLAQVELLERNDAAWKAFFDMEVLVNLVKTLGARSADFGGLQDGGIGNKPKVETVSPSLRRALRVLDDASMALDRGGLPALQEVLDAGYASLRNPDSLVKGVLTGHAHIDLVWLWNEISGEYKARHTFASMNELMGRYPEFHFAYSQSASYAAVARQSPALLDLVKQRVKEGRWEAVGATYVESDTLAACGEALARSFLVGQESFQSLFGESSRLLWLPDVFGYCGCLPQIMRQCGVDRFFTTKLTWSNIHLFPYSSFRWRGTDGSEVLTHVTQGLGYNQNAKVEEVLKAANEYRQSDVHDEFLLPTGFGDGGGGVTPEMIERARRIDHLAGVPNTRWGRLEDFYDNLDRVREKLPVYQGELYLEYHRGTFSTHSDLKRDFRALERALQQQEAVHSLLGKGPIDVHAWQRLVFSQFHDYIPGSSIWEVYEEGLPELRALAAQAIGAAQEKLGQGELVANLLPMPRPFFANGFRVVLPPLSVCHPDLLNGDGCYEPVAEALQLSSTRVTASFNERGEVSSLIIDGQPAALAAPLNQYITYPDFPHQFDAWDIDRQTLHLGQTVDSPAEALPFTAAEGVAGLAFRRRIGANSSIEIRYQLDAVLPVLQVEVVLDWQETNTLLKASFPTTHMGRFARYGSPFNSVLRGQLPGDPKDEAMFEVCGSRWAVVMDDSQSDGLSLITEAKFGFSCREGNLGLTLIRSVCVTGEDDGHRKGITSSIRDNDPRPQFTDLGRHVLRYAIGSFHAAQIRADQPAALADLLYTPVLPASTPASAGLLDIEGGDSLIPAWAKPLDNGAWILRLHEVLGRSGTAHLVLADGWTAERCNLAETECGDCGPDIGFRPYEIVSVRLQASTK